MANIEKLRANLERHGFKTSCFDTAEAACDYLNNVLDGSVIGFGGSVTVQQMGLYDRLKTHNTCLWHWDAASGVSPAQATAAPVYICSVNGVAETGELINIDGGGNRVAATVFAREKLFFVISENKIAPDCDSALWRARNIAAPLNARRLGKKTPCALAEEMKCYDCTSPDRICCSQVTLLHRPRSVKEAEVIIIREELGY